MRERERVCVCVCVCAFTRTLCECDTVDTLWHVSYRQCVCVHLPEYSDSGVTVGESQCWPEVMVPVFSF